MAVFITIPFTISACRHQTCDPRRGTAHDPGLTVSTWDLLHDLTVRTLHRSPGVIIPNRSGQTVLVMFYSNSGTIVNARKGYQKRERNVRWRQNARGFEILERTRNCLNEETVPKARPSDGRIQATA